MANGQNPMSPILQMVQPKREAPMGETMAQMIQQRAQASPLFTAQREGIKETQAELDLIKKAPKKKDLTALAALTDIFSGTKGQFTQAYQALKPKDRTKEMQELKKLLSKQQQSLTDDELKFMQNQMIGMGSGGGGGGASGLTPFEKKRDEAFAKDVAKWSEGGGFAKVVGNIDALREVHTKLGEPGDLTNTVVPQGIREMGWDQESAAAEQQVGFVVQQSLKEILGGQFSEKEGVELIKRSYNPRLTDEKNQEKLGKLIQRLEVMSQSKQQAIDYATKHGTLKGWEGASGANSLSEWQIKQSEMLKKEYEVGGKAPKMQDLKTPAARKLAEEFGL